MKAYSTLIKNPERKIKYKKFAEGGAEHFHLGVWVDGSEEELSVIDRVEYALHPTFKNRVRTSKAKANGFSITFWAWGTFDIEITIFNKDGTTESFEYPMTFELPADDGSNYIDVSDL